MRSLFFQSKVPKTKVASSPHGSSSSSRHGSSSRSSSPLPAQSSESALELEASSDDDARPVVHPVVRASGGRTSSSFGGVSAASIPRAQNSGNSQVNEIENPFTDNEMSLVDEVVEPMDDDHEVVEPMEDEHARPERTERYVRYEEFDTRTRVLFDRFERMEQLVRNMDLATPERAFIFNGN